MRFYSYALAGIIAAVVCSSVVYAFLFIRGQISESETIRVGAPKYEWYYLNTPEESEGVLQPGSSHKISGKKRHQNDGGRNMIIALKLSLSAYIEADTLFEECGKTVLDLETEFPGEYYFKNDKIYLTEKRYAEVFNFYMKRSNSDWLEFNGTYFALVKSGSSVDEGDFRLDVYPELGGNVLKEFNETGKPTFRTPSRVFEQYIRVQLNSNPTVVQASVEAFTQRFGSGALEAVYAAKKNGWFEE
jgi:hypothetical protein